MNMPTTHVPVVVPIAANDATSPPKTPWQAALARLYSGLAVLAPLVLTFIVDPLVTYFSHQTVTLPDAYKTWAPVVAIVASGLVAVYQALRKHSKESDRLAFAQAVGLADSNGNPTSLAVQTVSTTLATVAAAQAVGAARTANPTITPLSH